MQTGTFPVFVVGCPRSGTTLLYHMLLSAGRFAIYHAETHAFNLLAPRFGDLRQPTARTRLADYWLTTEYFRRSGLVESSLRSRIIAECRSPGDFLRIVMESIAEQQGASRWAECTPEHLLYITDIKRTIPDAKVIHIIRDGRDVALSLEKQSWIRPLAPDRSHSLLVAGLYWEWAVKRGRMLGSRISPDYLEVNFERLLANAQDVLSLVGEFIEQRLDYQEIMKSPLGSVAKPNSSFTSAGAGEFNPVGRWRSQTSSETERLETLIGPTLREFGYDAAIRNPLPTSLRGLRLRYHFLFSGKQWLKSRTPLARLVNTSLLDQPIGSQVQRV